MIEIIESDRHITIQLDGETIVSSEDEYFHINDIYMILTNCGIPTYIVQRYEQ